MIHQFHDDNVLLAGGEARILGKTPDGWRCVTLNLMQARVIPKIFF
jgi:hypothetical protein